MVCKDDDLISKNRGPTSALLAAQLLKITIKRFSEGKDGIDLSKYLQSCISVPALY